MQLAIAITEDIPQIYALMQQVYNDLQDKSFYVCDSYDFIEQQIKHRGFAVKATCSGGEMIGALIVRYPNLDDDNLGRDIGISENELSYVAHMESAIVHPEYRGQNLLQGMLLFAERFIDINKYCYLCATVSPDNTASRNSLINSGYHFVCNKEKYGGLSRDIFLKGHHLLPVTAKKEPLSENQFTEK